MRRGVSYHGSSLVSLLHHHEGAAALLTQVQLPQQQVQLRQLQRHLSEQTREEAYQLCLGRRPAPLSPSSPALLVKPTERARAGMIH